MPEDRHEPPIRNSIIEIAGDHYLLANWFGIDDGEEPRDCLAFFRLNEEELAVHDSLRTTAELVGTLLPLIEKRFGWGKAGSR